MEVDNGDAESVENFLIFPYSGGGKWQGPILKAQSLVVFSAEGTYPMKMLHSILLASSLPMKVNQWHKKVISVVQWINSDLPGAGKPLVAFSSNFLGKDRLEFPPFPASQESFCHNGIKLFIGVF